MHGKINQVPKFIFKCKFRMNFMFYFRFSKDQDRKTRIGSELVSQGKLIN